MTTDLLGDANHDDLITQTDVDYNDRCFCPYFIIDPTYDERLDNINIAQSTKDTMRELYLNFTCILSQDIEAQMAKGALVKLTKDTLNQLENAKYDQAKTIEIENNFLKIISSLPTIHPVNGDSENNKVIINILLFN
jgi:hypothetical protein